MGFAVFLVMLCLTALGVAIAALVLAVRAQHRIDDLSREVRRLTLLSRGASPAAARRSEHDTSRPAAPPPPFVLEEIEPPATEAPAAPALPVTKAPLPEAPPASEKPAKPAEPVTSAGPASRTAALVEAFTAATPASTSATGSAESPPPPTGSDAAAAAPEPADDGVRWEERLGARLPVWLGAIALALAAAYFVKFSFDRNLISEQVRVIIGIMVGLVMLGLGEWLRPREQRIGQGVTAAGVATLFTTTLAAVNYYHMVGPVVGFIAMAGVTAIAVVLSLRQGPLVALLGLLGGFLTPALIGTETQHPAGLFTFLLLLQVGLLVIIRRRGWWVLGLIAMVGGMVWVALWMTLSYDPQQSGWAGAFLLVSALLFVGAAPQRHTVARILGWAAMTIGLLLACALIGVGGYTGIDWAFLGLLAFGALVLARFNSTYEPMAWLGATIVLIMLLVWNPGAAEHTRFAITAAAVLAALAGGAFACVFGATRPDRFAIFSFVVAVAGLVIVGLSLPEPGTLGGWLPIALGMAALYAGGAALVHRQRGEAESWQRALAALVLAVVVLVSLGVFMHFERQWITVLWAVELPLLALAFRWLRLNVLAHAAWAIGGLVLLRAVGNPMVATYPIAEHPLWTWLLYGYGVPIACFAASAVGFARWSEPRPAHDQLPQWLGGGAVALGAVFIVLLTRQAFHPAAWLRTTLYVDEIAVGLTGLLALGLGLLAADRRWRQPAMQWGGAVVVLSAAALALLGPALAFNPLWHAMPVRVVPLWLAIILAYLLPAALVGAAAWRLSRLASKDATHFASVMSLIMTIAGATLLVRFAFHGESLTLVRFTLTEWGVLSTVWLSVALVLLHAARQWQGAAMLRTLAVGWTALAAAQVVAAQGILDNPLFVPHDVRGIMILNSLLLVYALPAAMLAWAARQLHLGVGRSAAKAIGVAALATAVLAVTLLVRHAFHGDDMTLTRFTLSEWGVLSTAWIMVGLALLRAAVRWPSPLLRGLALVWIVVAAAQVLLMQGLFDSPLLWGRHTVQGVTIFNTLLLAYALPAALLGAAGWLVRKHLHPAVGHVLDAVALLLLFVFVSLQVRHAFQGPVLVMGRVQQAEWYAYSAAWIGLAGALLAAGLITGGRVLRWASLVVMLLAVGKVFLSDAAHLKDLYRVLSFMGLGVSLLVLAWVYQRFVFARPTRPTPPAQPAEMDPPGMTE